MRKIILTLCLLPLFCAAQEEFTAVKKDSSKFAIGISASADRCFRLMYTNPVTGKFAVSRYADELPILGFTTGVNFQWRISKRWCMDAGMLYSLKGFKSDEYELGSFITIDPNDPAIPKTFQSVYHFTYVDIPVRMQFHFTTGKLQFYGLAGMSTNIFINETTISHKEFADGHKTTTKYNESGNFARVNLAATAGLGLKFNLKNSFIKLETVYRTSVTSITNTDVHYYLTQAGIDVGYYFRF